MRKDGNLLFEYFRAGHIGDITTCVQRSPSFDNGFELERIEDTHDNFNAVLSAPEKVKVAFDTYLVPGTPQGY